MEHQKKFYFHCVYTYCVNIVNESTIQIASQPVPPEILENLPSRDIPLQDVVVMHSGLQQLKDKF